MKKILTFALLSLCGFVYAGDGNGPGNDTIVTGGPVTNQGGAGGNGGNAQGGNSNATAIGAGGNAASNATGGNAESIATGGNALGVGISGAKSNAAAGANANSYSGSQSNANSTNINSTGPSLSVSSTDNANNASQSVNTGSNVTITHERNVSSAYAPTIAPTAVCMGSTSGGAQGASFGFSVGTTWVDKNCELLEQVRAVSYVLGDRESAAEMLCSLESYREARLRVGKPCKAYKDAAQAKAQSEPTDPYIRRRLGLPALTGE